MTTLSTATNTASPRRSRGRIAVRRIILAIAAFIRARLHRREVGNLLRLDDRMLKDIGLTRSDVLGALAEPAGVDPSIGLRLRSVENRLGQRDREVQARRMTRDRVATRPRKSSSRAAA